MMDTEDLTEAILPAYPQDDLARAVLRWAAANPQQLLPSPETRLFTWLGTRSRAHFLAEVRAMVERFWLHPPPKHRDRLTRDAERHFAQLWGRQYGGLQPRGLCSYIRHKHSNYDQIVGHFAGARLERAYPEVYEAVKLYLCCRIIRSYGLHCDPRDATFGSNRPFNWPERYRDVPVASLEQLAAAELGMEGVA